MAHHPKLNTISPGSSSENRLGIRARWCSEIRGGFKPGWAGTIYSVGVARLFDDAVAVVRADPSSIASEARRLCAALTLEERLGCLDGDTEFWPGMADMLAGGYYKHPYPAAEVYRIGAPGIWFSDGPRGVVVGYATAFPVAMARGATWDPDLEERIGRAMALELRASGANFTGAVCVNLLRHPAWGRAQETYGESSFHVGQMGAALVRGLETQVMACVKHLAVNSIECARFQVDVTIDDAALHEVYLPHFKQAIDAGASAVMSAYNSMNGTWCGENAELLTGVLRDEWHFDGIVVSDFIFGLRDSVRSVEAGLDIEMPFRQQRARDLPGALSRYQLDMSTVDAAVERVLAAQLRWVSRHREPPPPISVVACDAHRALARQAAEQSMTLLRNVDSFLPLPASARIVVIGELATERNLGDRGSSDVHPPEVTTFAQGLQQAFEHVDIAGINVESAAAKADIAVVVVGYTAMDEGEYVLPTGVDVSALFPTPKDDFGRRMHRRMGANREPDSRPRAGGDRASLRLSAAHEALIARTVAANPRTVVVVVAGSAVVMPWVDSVPAVLLAWYAGMEGGNALGAVLTGAANPGGRLPFTIAKDEADYPVFDRWAHSITYDQWHGDAHLARNETDPAFPFGFGLSYTTFELRDLTVFVGVGIVTFTVSVVNTGPCAGSDVVQIYIGPGFSDPTRPDRQLRAFRRVHVGLWGTERVTLSVEFSELAVRSDAEWTVRPGQYCAWVSRYARDPEFLFANFVVPDVL